MADASMVVIIRFSEVMMKLVANKYSFHDRMNTKANVDANPGREIGSRMRISDWRRVQPSTMADSSSSREVASNTERRFQMANGRLMTVLATIKGMCESYRSSLTAITN